MAHSAPRLLNDHLAGTRKRDFAERIGISQPYLSQILGGRVPAWHVIAKIERETGGAVPVSAWLDDEAAA